MIFTFECVIAGALGGLIKSLRSHKGKLYAPFFDKQRGYFFLGLFSDIAMGGFVGFLMRDPFFYGAFGAIQPNLALTAVMGFLSDLTLENLLSWSANRMGKSDHDDDECETARLHYMKCLSSKKSQGREDKILPLIPRINVPLG
jgi:hypothetical protein